MINSLDQLFYEPIEESNNFRFLLPIAALFVWGTTVD